MDKKKELKTHTFFVRGMHCSSCELLIEKKLLKTEGVKFVDASVAKGEVSIEYEGKKPSVGELNGAFRSDGYAFFDELPGKNGDNPRVKTFLNIAAVSLLIIFGFFILQRLGIASLINVNSKSALSTFFLFGVLAGISSCAALVGGLVLSMSKQWLELYSQKDSFWHKFQPHLLFNLGRLLSFAVLGAILGLIGQKLQFSLTASSLLVMAVSVVMILLALQMLGFKSFKRFQFTLPKSITHKLTDESRFKGRFMPFSLGAFTFFLPCGFTLTVQGLALLSGNVSYGSLIMLLFALGTLPSLLLIGISSIKFLKSKHLSEGFLKVAGILVLFFALFNINSQFNILGLPSFNGLAFQPVQGNQNAVSDKDLPPIIDGKQLIKMKASATGYNPNYFKVRVGVPVKWEIEDTGTSGCTNAVISRQLFEGEISLTPGKTSVKEFIPQKTGRYKFSCWMGMVSGVMEVVDPASGIGSAPAVGGSGASDSGQPLVGSGAAGCGCGGSGGSCGGIGTNQN